MHETTKDGFPVFYASTKEEWRQWLAENHDKEKSVWLIIYHMKSDRQSVYYDEAVDEALCFGWVDSKVNKRDGNSYYQYFAKRNPKSNWSRINKDKIEKLEKEGRLAKPGLKMVELARATGTWTALDDVENLVIPDDLKELFDANAQAWEYFDAFPRSVKRGILEWIFNAKRPATRQKRIQETVSLASENIRANQYRQPKGRG